MHAASHGGVWQGGASRNVLAAGVGNAGRSLAQVRSVVKRRLLSNHLEELMTAATSSETLAGAGEWCHGGRQAFIARARQV
jgi:hypothetical protein